ncbi:MAG: hypothetical protein KGI50_00980 [Patescibacteria group bacterium]|nr:hypothetical protein [Patescibacteria group bacterium]MDE2438075.1 hypothetical protein [Patescibacteria group bacterium]
MTNPKPRDLERYLHTLQNGNENDDGFFKEAFATAIELKIITLKDAIDEFCFDSSTIERWSTGDNSALPALNTRPWVVSWLVAHTEVKLRALRAASFSEE